MSTNLKIKVGPQFYRYHEGAIDFIPKVLNEYCVEKILIVHGIVSWQKAKDKLTFLETSKKSFFFHQYTGECSYYGAELIAEMVQKESIDFIIGVGGGKLSDLVGYAAHLSNVNFGVIPTLASNCAPWTPLSVMYKENGEAEGKTEHYMRQATFLITDPYLIIDSPVSYFIAGLADTLAKWYEAESILSQNHLKNSPFLKMASYTSYLCKEMILTSSGKAIQDMKDQNVSDEFIELSEVVIAIAGMVGGLGDKYARNAAAHAMHDAMSKYIPSSHQFLHGEKVAYGIFYQLALESKWSWIDHLLPFYQELNLPTSLKCMGIYPDTVKVIDKMIQFIDSKEKVHLLPITITQERLKTAIYELEKYVNEI